MNPRNGTSERLERPDDDGLDLLLESLDTPPPRPRAGLHEDIQRAFERDGPVPRIRRPWLPAAICAAAAAIGWLLVSLAPEATPQPTEPASMTAARVSHAGETLRELELELLAARLRAAESRLIANLEEPVVEPPAEPETESDEEPQTPPAPLFEGAVNLPRHEQVALLRLALLERSDSDVLGVEELRRRLDELAGTYEGTVSASRARQWADRLDS